MEVFVFNIGWNYEGEATCGVYATLDEAIKAAERNTSYCDDKCIYRCTLGSDDKPVEVWPKRKQ